MDPIAAQVIIAFVFGVVFVAGLIVIAIKFPDPPPFAQDVFRIVLSLAAAGTAAMIPGFINIEVNATIGLMIRAGGALGVFVIVFFFNPAQLSIQRTAETKGHKPNDSEPGKMKQADLIKEKPLVLNHQKTDVDSIKSDEKNIAQKDKVFKFTLKFKDAFHPSTVSVKSLIQHFESSEKIKVEIEWPIDQNAVLQYADKLLGDAESYESPDSHFYGFSEQEVEEWLNIRPSIIKARELRRRVSDRILNILDAMKKWTTESRITSLKNYLTIANFDMHASIAFYLTQEKLNNRFLPESWQLWYKEHGLGDRGENIAAVNALQEPVLSIFSSKVCGEMIDVGVIGPKSMVEKAWKRDVLNEPTYFPFFVEYVIPQVEWHLTEKLPEKHIKYKEDKNGKFVTYRKLVDD